MKQLDRKVIWLWFTQNIIGFPFTVLIFLFFFGWIFGVVSALKFPTILNVIYQYSVIHTKFLLISLFLLDIIYSYIFSLLSHHFYKYSLTELGFKKEYGIIWKNYVSIPYDRIQNVDIYRGLISRLLGLSDLQVHTAGVGGIALGEGRLPGLSKEIAEQLRDELIARSRSSHSTQGL